MGAKREPIDCRENNYLPKTLGSKEGANRLITESAL
jgi:hypothetical protein